MPDNQPPQIFSRGRKMAARRRMLRLQSVPDAPRYFAEDIVEDMLERLGFLRFEPARALLVGDYTGSLTEALRSRGIDVSNSEPADGFDEESPCEASGFDFIASIGTLDTVNDLPGALIHIRNALSPGGLMIASLAGAGSLPILRETMLVADGERAAPRIHPQVDVRAGGQLLQRTGFADPVVDSRHLEVSFGSLDRLVADLRAQGLSNVLADPGPPLTGKQVDRARAAFAEAGQDGRTVERFEILTLSGWRR